MFSIFETVELILVTESLFYNDLLISLIEVSPEKANDWCHSLLGAHSSRSYIDSWGTWMCDFFAWHLKLHCQTKSRYCEEDGEAVVSNCQSFFVHHIPSATRICAKWIHSMSSERTEAIDPINYFNNPLTCENVSEEHCPKRTKGNWFRTFDVLTEDRKSYRAKHLFAASGITQA